MMKFDLGAITRFLKNKNNLLLLVAMLIIIFGGFLVYTNVNFGKYLSFMGMSPEAVANKSIEYLNKNILTGTTTASLVKFGTENGLVKITIKIGANQFDSYATKDGKMFFPEAFKLDEITNTAPTADNSQPTATAKTCEDVKKSDKPILEAYVVSACPFGLQMQRVLADIVKSQPSAALSIKVMYMGAITGGKITAMHGDAEAQENLKQICIRDEQNSKYWNYVSCYMQKGDTAGCLASTGVDQAKLNTCISDPGKGLAYAQKDFDLNTKYNVTGSPTLVLAGEQVSEFDFGGRTSEGVKSLLCCGFNTKPGFCSAKLNTASAASSFSLTYAADASANAGSNAANCAPATPQ